MGLHRTRRVLASWRWPHRLAALYRGRARCPHRAAIIIQRTFRLNVIMSHPSTAPTTAFQGHPNANVAAPKSNDNSASELGRASYSLLGAGEMRPRRRRRVARGEAKPRSGRKRPRGIGESFGKAITHLKRRGEQPTEGRQPKDAGLGSFSLALRNRENPPEENGTPHPPRNPTQTRGRIKQPFYTPPKTTAPNPARSYRRECDNRERNTRCPTTNDVRPLPSRYVVFP